jgi:hypothetical protein
VTVKQILPDLWELHAEGKPVACVAFDSISGNYYVAEGDSDWESFPTFEEVLNYAREGGAA